MEVFSEDACIRSTLHVSEVSLILRKRGAIFRCMAQMASESLLTVDILGSCSNSWEHVTMIHSKIALWYDTALAKAKYL